MLLHEKGLQSENQICQIKNVALFRNHTRNFRMLIFIDERTYTEF